MSDRQRQLARTRPNGLKATDIARHEETTEVILNYAYRSTLRLIKAL